MIWRVEFNPSEFKFILTATDEGDTWPAWTFRLPPVEARELRDQLESALVLARRELGL